MKRCPSCSLEAVGETEIEERFGWRTDKGKRIPQSKCKDCRKKKGTVPAAKGTEKGTVAIAQMPPSCRPPESPFKVTRAFIAAANLDEYTKVTLSRRIDDGQTDYLVGGLLSRPFQNVPELNKIDEIYAREQAGELRPNEIRFAYGQPPLKEINNYLTPLNMASGTSHINLKPRQAANLFRLLVGSQYRDDDDERKFALVLKAHCGLYALPPFTETEPYNPRSYYSGSADRHEQQVDEERVIADFLIHLGQALHAWADEEQARRDEKVRKIKAAADKEREKRKKAKEKQKERNKSRAKEEDEEEEMSDEELLEDAADRAEYED